MSLTNPDPALLQSIFDQRGVGWWLESLLRDPKTINLPRGALKNNNILLYLFLKINNN
jgi:hypothetical protein